jgi:hypothetical protein
MDKAATIVAVLVCMIALAGASLFGQPISGQPNPEPIIAPGTDLNKGSEAPLRRSHQQMIANHLELCLDAYTSKSAGRLPDNWDQLEETLGAGIWESATERELTKRRFALVSSDGNVPHSSDNGPIEGTLVVAPLYPIQEQRSAKQGRFTVWRSEKGTFATRWLTESELRTFSNWPEVATKIEGMKAEVAQMPPLVIGSTPVPTPHHVPSVEPPPATTSSPVPLRKPMTPALQAPVATVERKWPVWPWVVGIVALILIVAFALKRRKRRA